MPLQYTFHSEINGLAALYDAAWTLGVGTLRFFLKMLQFGSNRKMIQNVRRVNEWNVRLPGS